MLIPCFATLCIFQVRAFCQQRGVQFEVVDMRWGIRDEATDDHQTLAICCSEIARCQEGTVGPRL